MTGRLLAGAVLLVGGIMLAEDGIDILLDALGELFVASVVPPANVTEGSDDAT